MKRTEAAFNTVFRDTDINEPSWERKHVCEEVSIEVTNECCLACAHCSSMAGKPFVRELTIQEIKDLIRVGKEELGTTVISLSGGEPLLRDGIDEVIRYISELGLKLLVYTCGNYPVRRNTGNWIDVVGYNALTYNMVEARVKRAIGAIFDTATPETTSIIFSVEGLTLTHDGLTGVRGSFDNMLTTAQNFGISGCVKTEAHFTPTKLNYRQLKDVYDVCVGASFSKFSILRLVSQGRCLDHVDELCMDRKEFLELLVTIKDMPQCSTTPIRIGDPCVWGFFWDKDIHRNCNAGINRILIRANGEAQFCAALKHAPNYDYGNVLKTPLKQLWDDSVISKVLRKLHYGEIAVQPCKDNCEFYENCMGGCTSQRIAFNGGMLNGPDPLCVKGLIEKKRKEEKILKANADANWESDDDDDDSDVGRSNFSGRYGVKKIKKRRRE